MVPTLLPLGIELILNSLGYLKGVPICLLLALVECSLAALFYWIALGWEGELFQIREQKILDVVTPKVE